MIQIYLGSLCMAPLAILIGILLGDMNNPYPVDPPVEMVMQAAILWSIAIIGFIWGLILLK